MSNINANDLQQSIFDAVDTIVSRRIKEIDYDKTIIGIIYSFAGIKNRKAIYRVEYAGGFFYASVLDSNDTYVKNMPVYVFVPQGDFSKNKIILGRANTINTSSNLNLVATAMNNYSILGKNVLELTDSSIVEVGVRSYHSKNTEPNDPIKHRYNVLYNSKNDIEDNFVKIADRQSLLAYVQEGTAILIRADFRTDLSTEQKNMAAARYGLSFKLKFKNENAGWGETQGDILDNISQRILGEISKPDYVEPQTISLVNIVTEIENIIKELKEDNFEDFISLDGMFSEQINLIEELYRVFITNNPEDNLGIIEETLRAYVGLLKELQTYSTIESIQEGYVEWCETSVESEEFKILPCLLDSNKMTGSPLYFKKPVTQYAIFEADLSNFVGIEEIALFKENFNENFSKDTKEDIFVQNIQFYILEPLDTVSGDYNLKVESLTTGSVLSEEKDSVTFTATLTRKIYEDLSANSNSYFYWFKEDPSVQVGADGYDMYGGKGWRLLYSTKESKRTFRTTFDENPSKKNNYKCVAIYKENQDTDVVLECPFIVYNSSKGEIIELQSDLGTVFQFDVGTPTITCLISGQETNVKNNSLDETIADYYFYWSLNTEDGQEILLYDENNEIDWSNLDIDSFSTYQMQDLYLKNIKFFKLDNDKVIETNNSLEATRLQYPMVNINTGSKVTIKCTVVAVNRENKNKIVQGSEELIFENRKGAVLTGYRIVFEHDNQIFQYDEYGNSPALKTKLDPQEILPIRAKLVGPNGLEISETNIQVDWIFPLEDTMIVPLNTLVLNPEDGLQNLLKNSNNCGFSISDQYNPDAINNQITCRIKYKNVNYYKDTNLFFRKIGENGTNGTDVTIRISPKSTATILNEQPLTLYTYPIDSAVKGFLNDNSYISDNNILEEINLTGENGYLETEVYQKGTQINSDKYKLMWNLAGNPSESSNSEGNVFDISLDKSNLTNIIKWPIKDQKYLTKKTYRLQNIKSHVKMTDAADISRDYYGYYPLPIIEYTSEKPPIYADRRIAIDKKTYLKEITYNADGRNPIYNHNQGLKLVNLPLGSTVVWKAKGGWTIGENNPDFSLIFKKGDTADNNHLLLTSMTEPTEEDWDNWRSSYKKNLINSYLDYVTTAVNCIEEYQTNWEKALQKRKQQEKEDLIELIKIACCNEIINKNDDEEIIGPYELFVSHLLDSKNIRIYCSEEDITENNYTVLKITPRLRYNSTNKLYYDYIYSIRDDSTGDYISVTIESEILLDEQTGESQITYGYRFINSEADLGKYDKQILSPSFEEIVYGDRQYIDFETWRIQEGKTDESQESFWSFNYDWVSNSLLLEDIEELNRAENEIDKNSFNQFKWGTEQLPYWWFTEDENIKWKIYTIDNNELNLEEITTEENLYWLNEKTQLFKEEYNKTLSTEFSDLFNKNDNNEENLPKDSTIFYYSEIKDDDLKKIFLDEDNKIKDFIQKYMTLFNISNWTELFDKNYNNYIEKTNYPSFETTFPDWKESSTLTILEENKTEASIYIIPNDEASGSSTNNRVEAEIYVRDSQEGTNDLYAIVYAPIIVTLNTFGLASLNAWDGNSVTVDEEGGYIMAPQMGAGEKDSNNRFTGIVMGKTETYTGGGDKEKQVGLFGYAHGLQSIFLDSETGNATFGLPDVYSEFDEDGNIIKKYQHTDIDSDDDYNEGRIELRPGDVSKIGGWRLGRRSFYYIENDEDIGPKYDNDYIPDKTGTIKFGDRYNSHHEKDIQEDSAGILLHSGSYPYLSIKGKKLDIEKDQLSDSSLSYLLDGDSLEVQIDPYTPTLFTIFRHNGQARYKDAAKTELLYPEGSRTYLAGINARGQLVANGLQNVTTPTDGSEGDTVTTFGVNAIPAFGESFETATHIGLMMDAADQMISKIFVKNIQQKDSTLYITGSGTQDNEYIRPISLNGKSIGLFASNDKSIYTTTDANIQISTNSYQTQLGNTLFKLVRKEENGENLLRTNSTLRINLGNDDSLYYPFIFNAANSEIKLYNGGTNYYSQIIKGSTQENDTTIPGGVSIETTYPNYSVESQNIKINMSDNRLDLFNKSNHQNSILLENDDGSWETGHNLVLKGKNQLKIQMSNNGTGSEYNSTVAKAQILIQAGTVKTNQSATQLFLNSSTNTWTTGSDGKGTQTGNKTNSWFRVNTTRTNNGIYLYDKIDESDNAQTHFVVDTTRLETTATANNISFGATNFSGSGKDPTYHSSSGGYYSINGLSTLQQAIDNCLKAAGLAYQRAVDAENNAEAYAHGLVYNNNGSAKWATAGHNHDNTYSKIGHTHSQYALASHTHDDYLKKGVSYALDGYSVVTSVSGSGITATSTPWIRLN